MEDEMHQFHTVHVSCGVYGRLVELAQGDAVSIDEVIMHLLDEPAYGGRRLQPLSLVRDTVAYQIAAISNKARIKNAILRAIQQGNITGTIEDVRAIVDSEVYIRDCGDGTRSQLRLALWQYEQNIKTQRPA